MPMARLFRMNGSICLNQKFNLEIGRHNYQLQDDLEFDHKYFISI